LSDGFAPGTFLNRQVGGQAPCRPAGFLILALERMDRAVKHGRALLADGHLGMLGGAHSLLEALFETVLMVADERSLVDAAATFRPDLVVVDLSLPREGEANVARRLLERHPDLRLIVLSVHDEPTVADQMLSAGVAGFVLKRAAATDLVPAVEEVRRGGVYVSAAVRPDCNEAAEHSTN
jgi:two-component system secretion response regulator SsrB